MGLSAARPMIPLFEYDADNDNDDMEVDSEESSAVGRPAAAAAAAAPDDLSRDPEAQLASEGEGGGSSPLDGAESRAPTQTETWPCDGAAPPRFSAVGGVDVVIGDEMDATSTSARATTLLPSDESGSINREPRGFLRFPYDLEHAPAPDATDGRDVGVGFTTASAAAASAGTHGGASGTLGTHPALVHRKTWSRPDQGRPASQGLGHDWLCRVLDFLRQQSAIRRLTCDADNHQCDDDENTVVVHYYCQLSLPDADEEAADAVDADSAVGMPSSPRRRRKKRRMRAVLHVERAPGGPTSAGLVVVTARDLAFGSVLTVVGPPESAAPAFGGPVLRPVRAPEAASRAPTPSFHNGRPTEPDPGEQVHHGTVPMAIDPDIKPTVAPEADSLAAAAAAAAAARPTPLPVVQPSRSEPALGTGPGPDSLAQAPMDLVAQDDSTSTAEHRWVPWVPHRPSCDMDATHHQLPSCTGTGIEDSTTGRSTEMTLSTTDGSPRPPSSKTSVADALGTSPDGPAEGNEDNPVPIPIAHTTTNSSSLVPFSKGVEPSVASSLSTPKAIRQGSRSLQGEQAPALGDDNTEKEELRDLVPKESFVAPSAAAGPPFGPSPVRREELEAVASPLRGKEPVEEVPNRPAHSDRVERPATSPAAAQVDSGTKPYGGSPSAPAPQLNVSAMEEEEDFSFPSPDPPTPSPKGKEEDYDDWVMYSSVPFRRNFGANDESPTFPSPDPPTPPERTEDERLEWKSLMDASSPQRDGPGRASPTAPYGLQPEGVADDLGYEPLESLKAYLGVPRLSPQGNPIRGSPRRTTTLQSNGDDPTFSSRVPSAPRNDDAADEGLDLARRKDKKHKKKKKSKKHKRKRSSSDDLHSPGGELLKPPPPSAPERTDKTSRVGCLESQLALPSTSRSRTEPVIGIHDPLVQPRNASRTITQGVGFLEVAGSVQQVAKRTSEVEAEPSTLKGILRTEHTRRSLSNEASQITVKDGSASGELTGRESLPGGSGSPRNTFARSDKATIEAAEPLRSSFTTASEAKQESVHEQSRLTGLDAAARGSLTQQVGFLATGGREDEIVSKNSPKRMRLDQAPNLSQQSRGLPLGWGSTRHFRANIRFDQYRKSAPSTRVTQDKRPAVHPATGKAYSRTMNSSSTLEPVELVRKSRSVFNEPIRGSQIPERSFPSAGPVSASFGTGPEQSQRQKWKVTPHLPNPLRQAAGMEPTQGPFHESAGAGPQSSQRQMWEVTHHMPNPSSQSADMKRAPGLVRESAGSGPENVQSRNITHHKPPPILPRQPEHEEMKNALGPLQQGPSPVRALCSEDFLSTWGDVAAELGSGRWAALSNANSRANGAQTSNGRRIELIDTSLVDQCAVDIEINDWGILLFTASALQTSDDAKMVVLSVARLVVLGRYSRLVIFLSYDVPITDSIARHIVQLQTAALCNGLKFPTDTFFKTTSPRALSAAIATSIFSKVDARHLPHIDNATHPSYRLWASFLLAICPKLCASGALKLLQLSQQVAPPNVNPLTFALKSEQFRRNIQDAVRTKSPTVGSIHPEAMPFLEKALLAPLKPR